MKRDLLAAALCRTGFQRALFHAYPWCGVLCLNYHRIGDNESTFYDRGLWSATEEDFDFQIQHIKRWFDVIHPGELPEAIRRKKGRFVLVTFDDGYRDNYTAAFPILKRHGVPATFFITTGFIDRPRLPWWDEIAWIVRTTDCRMLKLSSWLPEALVIDPLDVMPAVNRLLNAYKNLPGCNTDEFLYSLREESGTKPYDQDEAGSLWMTWGMLREMQSAGMSIGGHTVNHPILARQTADQQRREIVECAVRLQEELGHPMQSFSYPVGARTAFDQHTRTLVREAGAKYAFSYYGGYRTFADWDSYDIRRVAIETYITRELFTSVLAFPQVFAS